jgi:hypothetical protein
MPSTFPIQQPAQFPKIPTLYLEALVFTRERLTFPDCFGIPVDRQQPSLRPEPFEDRARVPASPEGPVDVNAIRTNTQLVHGLFEQHRHMRRYHSTTPWRSRLPGNTRQLT